MDFPLSQDEPLSFGGATDEPPEMSLAPFIDIVLQIICFYIFVAGSMQHYSDPDVLPPKMVAAKSLEQQPAEVVVNIKADGSMLLNERRVTLAELGPLLLERRQRLDPVDADRLRVTVRADRRQRYGPLEDVLQVCRKIGLPRILLRTVEADPQ